MRVCVIGAGASGLPAAKKLLDAGLEPAVFERSSDLGGNWLYGSSVYRSTHLISSKRMTEYRDFPMPEEWPPYIRHDQALEYLRRYADRFDLRRHIRFGVEVIRCEREPDGRWRVETTAGTPVFYKNLFHPHIDNLFFLGLIQPNSGSWFLAELQAELMAQALAHPSSRLRAAIADRQDTCYFDYLPSPRHHLEVDYLRYERDLRKLLRLIEDRRTAA